MLNEAEAGFRTYGKLAFNRLNRIFLNDASLKNMASGGFKLHPGLVVSVLVEECLG